MSFGTDLFEEIHDIGNVFLKAEAALTQRYHLRVRPVGDIHLMIG